ncbi:hypothetical protein OV450_6008 [Actinobacteria bacterium OV450]|nr:hypothetical protein OV450_6008 [Actinobacteria bacterium OV450]
MVITGYRALRYLAPAHLREREPLLDPGTAAYAAGADATGAQRPVQGVRL